jgi:hypothetical protein
MGERRHGNGRPRQPKEPTLARYTYVYEYVRDRWLIAQHHSSVRPEQPK